MNELNNLHAQFTKKGENICCKIVAIGEKVTTASTSASVA